MAFQPPKFNLMANIWHAPGGFPIPVPPIGPPSVTQACQLRMYKTAFQRVRSGDPVPMAVLFQKRFDVRPSIGFAGIAGQGDVIELPAGSGRYYRVLCVDDVARGFSNEYRLAHVEQALSPIPIP